MMNPFHWLENGTVSIASTSTSARVAMPANTPTGRLQIRVHNKGPNAAFIRKGADATVVALTTDMPIPAGAVEVLTLTNRDAMPITHIAAICATSETATLYFTIGAGI